MRDAHFDLAAAAAIVIAAATVIGGGQTVVAAAAEQQDQNDDPPAAIPTETIVAHNEYLRIDLSSYAAHSKIFESAESVQKEKTD